LLTNTTSNSNSTLGPPAHPFSTNHLAIADTGSTANFGTIDVPVLNKRPTLNPITIHNPNGSIMTSTHEAELDLPMLPPAARHIHIVEFIVGWSTGVATALTSPTIGFGAGLALYFLLSLVKRKEKQKRA
jgi:hypothetical protein